MTAVIRLVPPGYHSIVPTAGVLVAIALVAVLSAAEVLRAHGSSGATVWRGRLEVAALPLVAATAFVVGARLAPLV